MDTWKAEQGLCRAGVQEVPARWPWRRRCRAVVPVLDSAGCQCQRRSWSRVSCSNVLVAAGAVLPGGLCSCCVSPDGAEVALCCAVWVSGWRPATTSPCPCALPTAAPDCARQNCRCQALHRKESGEGGRGGGTSAQQQGCEVQINLLLCWCRSEAPRPPAQCRPTVIHAQLRGGAGPGAGHSSPVLPGTAGAQDSVGPRLWR